MAGVVDIAAVPAAANLVGDASELRVEAKWFQETYDHDATILHRFAVGRTLRTQRWVGR